MIARVQMLAKRLGEGGCKFLSLLMCCEKETGVTYNVLAAFEKCIARGFVKEDGFMSNTEAMLEEYCGGKWRELWAGTGARSDGAPYDLPIDYVCVKGEYDILRYERPADASLGEKEPMPHFGLGDGRGGKVEGGDPWGDSRTFREGKLVSRRILRRLV